MYFVEIPLLLNNDLIDKVVNRSGRIDFEEIEAYCDTEIEGNKATIIFTKSGNEYITGMNGNKFTSWFQENVASYNAFIDPPHMVSS